jgi:hypothetical protein
MKGENKIMKKTILVLFAMTALALMMSFSVATPAASNPPAAKPVAVGTPAPAAAPATPEPHPEIREALASLRRAKDHLEHAAHDFDGHRVDAIKAIDESIRQLELCLKFDR